MVKKRTSISVIIAIFTTAAPLAIVRAALSFVTAKWKTRCVTSDDMYARIELQIGVALLL